MPPRHAAQRLRDMLEALDNIEAHCAGLTFDDFKADLKTLQAVLYNIAVLGEAASSLPDDLRERHAEVPWRDIRNMRNVLVHVYFGVDPRRVWDVATSRVVALRQQLNAVLAAQGQSDSAP